MSSQYLDNVFASSGEVPRIFRRSSHFDKHSVAGAQPGQSLFLPWSPFVRDERPEGQGKPPWPPLVTSFRLGHLQGFGLGTAPDEILYVGSEGTLKREVESLAAAESCLLCLDAVFLRLIQTII